MAMADDRVWSDLEPPARGPQSPAELHVAGRADALREPADCGECLTAHEQVPGRRRPGLGQEACILAKELSGARVARNQRALGGVALDLSAHGAAARVRRGREIGIEKAGRRLAVG